MREHSLAARLAKLGYDVWLGNNRCSMYSRKHIKYDANNDQEAFFNFTFYEIA